jgi:tyrosinase
MLVCWNDLFAIFIKVNGDMEDRSTSSNDPIFFTHHAFIDYVWEMWRQKRQNPQQRESDYPADIIDCMPPWCVLD